MGSTREHEEPPLLPHAVLRPVAVVSVVAMLLVVAVGFMVAGEDRAASFDRAVRSRLATSTAATRLALLVDYWGEPVGLGALVFLLVAVSLLLRRTRVAVLVVLGVGLTITLTTALKPVVGRTIHDVYLSYPSGHTASATALAMSAVLLVWHGLRPGAALVLLYGVAFVVGAAAAWAQAILVAHYPSDTVSGWLTALAVIPTTARLVDQAALRWSGWQEGRRPFDPGT